MVGIGDKKLKESIVLKELVTVLSQEFYNKGIETNKNLTYSTRRIKIDVTTFRSIVDIRDAMMEIIQNLCSGNYQNGKNEVGLADGVESFDNLSAYNYGGWYSIYAPWGEYERKRLVEYGKRNKITIMFDPGFMGDLAI